MKSNKTKINTFSNKNVIKLIIKLLMIELTTKELNRISDYLMWCDKIAKCLGRYGILSVKRKSDILIKDLVMGTNRNIKDQISEASRKRYSWVFNLWTKSVKHKIFIITILSYHRNFRFEVKPMFTSIIKHSIFSVVRWELWFNAIRFNPITWWSTRKRFDYLRSRFRVIRKNISKDYNMYLLNLQSTGPNGSEAFRCYIQDTVAFYNSGYFWSGIILIWIQSLWIHSLRMYWFIYACLKRSGKPFVYLKGDFITDKTKFYLESKLSFLRDKSGKQRVIAIGDLWSQSILKFYHNLLFKILKEVFVEVDGTFDQALQKKRVQEWTLTRSTLYSFDLSAATDRFPVYVQCDLLYLFGVFGWIESYCWKTILTDRIFAYRTWPTSKTKAAKRNTFYKYIRYSVGQPMGFYSSWAAFSVAHHIIIQLCAIKAGFRPEPGKRIYTGYALLGDDVTIRDPLVAKEYRNVMTSILDVSINLSKSYIGEGVAEFAKSLYVKGEDISSLPWGLLMQRIEYIREDVVELLQHLGRRGIAPDYSTFVKAIDWYALPRPYWRALLSYPGWQFYYDLIPWPNNAIEGYKLQRLYNQLEYEICPRAVYKLVQLVAEDPFRGDWLISPIKQKADEAIDSLKRIPGFDQAIWDLIESGDRVKFEYDLKQVMPSFKSSYSTGDNFLMSDPLLFNNFKDFIKEFKPLIYTKLSTKEEHRRWKPEGLIVYAKQLKLCCFKCNIEEIHGTVKVSSSLN